MKHTITIVFALILAASGLTSSHAQAPIRGNILAQIFVKNSTSLALKLNLEFWKRGDYFVSPVTEMEFRKSGNTTLLRIRRGTGDDWVSLDVNTIQRIDFNVMDKPVPGPVPPGTGGPTTEPSPGTTGAREKVFVDPKLNGRYINNCLTWATNCGKPAADYFCQQNGFVEAASFNIINLRPTLVMGDGKVCDESGCGGFSRIVCAGRSSGPEVNNPPPESPPSVGTGTYVGPMEANTDMMGLDIRSLDLQVADPVACQAECLRTPDCYAPRALPWHSSSIRASQCYFAEADVRCTCRESH